MTQPSREEPKSNDIFVVAMVLVGLLFIGGLVTGIGFVVVNHLGAIPDRELLASFFGKGEVHRPATETILSADQAVIGTPLRAHPDHPWFNLVKAEIEQPGGRRVPVSFWQEGQSIVVDYESSANFTTHPVMSHSRVLIVLKNEQGGTVEIEQGNLEGVLEQIKARGTWLMGDDRRSSAAARAPEGFGPDVAPKFTPSMEIFVLLEDLYEPNSPKRFKISNSLMIGNEAKPTLAREWNEEEIQKIEESIKTNTPPATKVQPQAVPAVNPDEASKPTAHQPDSERKRDTIGSGTPTKPAENVDWRPKELDVNR